MIDCPACLTSRTIALPLIIVMAYFFDVPVEEEISIRRTLNWSLKVKLTATYATQISLSAY